MKTATKKAPARKSAGKSGPKLASARRAATRITRRGAMPERTARGFDAGKTGRRLRAIPTTGTAINTLIRRYGKNIVARSRYLVANNSYAAAAKEAYVSALVGSGIKPTSLVTDKDLKSEITLLWNAWCDEADADGVTDFYGLQTLIANEMFEAGECFIRIRKRFSSDGLTVPFQLQVLPSEMLATDHNEVLANNGGRIEMGIEFSPIGQRVAYWFYRKHPNEFDTFTTSVPGWKTRVPAEEVLHLFKPMRAGQIRGVPHTISTLVTLSMIDLYDDAELERKRTAALFSAFVKRNPGEGEEQHPFAGADASPHEGNSALSDFSMEPGAIIDLDEGQDVAFAEPADVGANYEVFQYRNLLRAAVGMGVTYSDMTGDLRQTNYSSIRAGEVKFRRRIESQQHQIMAFQFCRPIWKMFFDLAVLYRALPVTAATYSATPLAIRNVKWTPPKWDWVDPLKDLQAEKLAVDSGFKARSDVIDALGEDAADTDSRIKADQTRASDLGIAFITLKTTIIVSPDDEDEDVNDPPPVPGASAEYDFG